MAKPMQSDEARSGYRLTPMQQNMLLRSLVAPGEGHYIQQLVCHISEAVQVDLLRHAWEILAGRHDILRACFTRDRGGKPRQHFASQRHVAMEVRDLADTAPDHRTGLQKSFLTEDRARGFDLSRPPWRLTLLRWARDAFTCIWTFHHCLLDGRSHTLLQEEFCQVYKALLSGHVPELSPAGSFAEYLDWLAAQPVDAAREYWQARLHYFMDAPGLPSLAVPLEDAADTDEHETQSVVTDEATTTRLRAGAERHGVTFNNLVQGAWALALGRYHAVEDVTFGAARAGRHWGGTEAHHRIGLFINTVPFRVEVTPDQRVGPWLLALRQQQRAVRAGELASLAQIREWVGLPGSLPLFRSVLVFEHFELAERLAQNDCTSRLLREVTLYEKTDLLTLAAYAGRRLTLALEYTPHRHSAAQVTHVLEHLRTLLEALAEAPADLPLSELNMLSPSERALVLDRWQGPPADYPTLPVSCLLENQASQTPAAPALEFEGQTLSYAELHRRANQLARRLLEWAQPGAPVCVILDRSPEQVIAWLALFKAGLVYAPLDAINPRARLEFYLQDLQPAAILTQRILLPDLPTGNVPVLCLDDDGERTAEAACDGANLPVASHPDEPACILFTSGSTGQPKGAINAHRGLSNLSVTLQKAYNVGPGDRVLQLSATTFDASIYEMILALQSGATLVLAPWEKLRPGPELAQFLEQRRITVFMPTPTSLRLTPVPLTSALRWVLCCGEPCPAEVVKSWGTGRRFVNIYGPTETAIWTTYDECRDDGNRPTIGRLVENYRGYVLDEKLRPLPVGVPGELYIGGPGVGLGYLNRPELSAERFLPDPFSATSGARMYRTGDLVRWLDDGRLDCLRRLDFQVKFQGVRVELGEIESALRQHPAVREAVVLLHDDRLLAWLVTDGSALTASELRLFLADHIQSFLIPGSFTFLPEMPRTTSGKISRQALLASVTATGSPAEPDWRTATADERNLVLNEWNRTDMPFPRDKSVVDFILEQVRAHPSAVALRAGARGVTYHELEQHSNHVAHRLRREALREEEPVALLFERSFAFVIAALGVFKAGGSYVPLDPDMPMARLRFLLADCGAGILLTHPNHAASWADWSGLIVTLDDLATTLASESEAESAIPHDPSRRAYIVYTSGSTGRPKGVEIEHHSLTNLVCVYHQWLQLTPRDRGSMIANIAFDASVADIWPCLCAGGTVLIPRPEVLTDPEALIAWLEAESVTFTFVPTVLAELMLTRPWPATLALRFLLTGGDTLHVRPRPGLPFTVMNTYGPAENTVDSTWAVVTAEGTDRPTIGRGIGNVRTYVLNAQMQPVPPGVAGELFLGGEHVARGYLNRPDRTHQRFLPDPFTGRPGAHMYRTGDWVRWRTDGELEFIGRLDDQVQIRGARVELGEVEETLRDHPGVREACCQPLLENGSVQGLIAYVVSATEPPMLRESLRAYLDERLPPYMLPRNITLLSKLPRNAAGKVDRKALPPPDPTGNLRLTNAAPPRTETEKRLVHLFEEVLGVQGVGIEDNFFEVGGHSLLALRLLNRVGEEFQRKLNIAALFQAPTVARLAERLQSQQAAGQLSPCVVVVQGAGTHRPVFCVTGAGGGSHWFQGIARHLGTDQPFYALEALGLSKASQTRGTIEAMANEFLPALRQIQPHGPYLLGGFSVGGHVALELAQRLRAAGEAVPLLFLVDAYGPAMRASFARRIQTYLGNFWRRSRQEKREFFSEKIAWLRFLLQVWSGNRDTRKEQRVINAVMKSQVKAAWRYQPQLWPGLIILFRSSRPPYSIITDHWGGWRDYAGAGMDVHVIPGDHFALFQPPRDAEIAHLLREHIAQAEAAVASGNRPS